MFSYMKSQKITAVLLCANNKHFGSTCKEGAILRHHSIYNNPECRSARGFHDFTLMSQHLGHRVQERCEIKLDFRKQGVIIEVEGYFKVLFYSMAAGTLQPQKQ